MTLKNFYDTVGGNYTDVIRRLFDEEIVYEFLFRFANESIFDNLQQAIAIGNREEAFTLIHTFKGTCANMGLGSLYTSAVQLTEALRTDFSPEAPGLFEVLAADYQTVITGIQALQAK